MLLQIRAKKVGDEEVKFRVCDEDTDDSDYLTEEMTESEVRAYMHTKLEEQIQAAKNFGCSNFTEPSVDGGKSVLELPWD